MIAAIAILAGLAAIAYGVCFDLLHRWAAERRGNRRVQISAEEWLRLEIETRRAKGLRP